ncbi:MAG: CobD/CbiB family cobalamin biosynthesis protein, partial [Cyanobium sp.]
SLEQAVQQVLELLPPGAAAPGCDLEPARRQLAWIVGRDTERLAEPEILRALAETASENAVDGLFAPLFWMLVGGGCSLMALAGLPLALVPGPLSLAWGFKASSTLDSMLGYRRGRLRWLGTAGARLDDALTWIPCRLVALSLPLAASRPLQTWSLFRQALQQGRPDPSPNAGVSQAAYALAAQVRLGGLNHYGGEPRPKPILAPDQPPADRTALARILVLSRRLLLIWLLIWLLAGSAISWRLGMLASLRPEVSRSTRPEPQVLRR